MTNVVNGLVSKGALLAANRVEAEMKDFDFDGVHYDARTVNWLLARLDRSSKVWCR